jgi:small subunit ribosomal protein S6
MQNYELTIVLPGKVTPAKKKDVIARVEKIVKSVSGKITASDDWGVKDLAYTIKKNVAGAYIYFDLELPASTVAGVSEKVKLEDDIIRHLLVRKEKHSGT